MPRQKRRVAILGGGMAGVAAAFELTSAPDWREHLEVTVYQEGWLLGGKGASVRNRRRAGRIEEHGIHLWLGFYDNAFRVMRACYEELGRPPGAPFRTLEEAFQPMSHVVHHERVGGTWRRWRLPFPENDGVPGQAAATRFAAARRRARNLLGLVQTARAVSEAPYGDGTPPAPPSAAGLSRLSAKVAGAWIASALGHVAARAPRPDGRPRLPDAARAALGRRLDDDDELRRLFVSLDLSHAVLFGMARDGLLTARPDYSRIDDVDFRAWLRRHGAHPRTVDSSLVRAIYDLAFSTDDGGAAGVALNGMLSMLLDYQGAIFYRMSAGMGETVFAPLYQVLQRRGVRFCFFHRVTRLELDHDGGRVDGVRFERQAQVRGGAAYQPLFDLDGLPCWPEEPLWEQLVDPEPVRARLRPVEARLLPGPGPEERLVAGQDFDEIILAIPPAALPPICAELTARLPRWRDALAHARTIRTAAVQLWIRPDRRQLGSGEPPAISGTFADPYDTWVDMSHLVGPEGDPAVGTILYGCGALGDGSAPVDTDPATWDRHQTALVESTTRYLGELDGLLPGLGASRAPEGVTGLLHAHGEAPAHDPAFYVRLNQAPSERYVLSPPGSIQHRLRPGETGLSNLAVAGDWTRTALSAGCIESATVSGLEAARSILSSRT